MERHIWGHHWEWQLSCRTLIQEAGMSKQPQRKGTSLENLPCRPRLVFWELTKGCNLRCIHCRATATELSSPADLSYEESAQVIDQLAVYAPFILVLSGGEPLFRRDIFRLARRATVKGIRVALATNGTLITESVAQEICDAGIRRVAISLDGPDAATHNAFP